MSVAARASLCFALLTACGASPPPPRAPASAPSDQLGKAVDLTLPTDSGELAGLPAADARATVADFFAPSCEPCAKKVPALYRRKAELEAMGAKLVLIGLLGGKESTEDARTALTSWGLPGAAFLVDSGDTSKREAGVRDLPTTLVLNMHGVVRWVASPGSTADDVLAATRAVTRAATRD